MKVNCQNVMPHPPHGACPGRATDLIPEIEARRADKSFGDRLRRRMDEDKHILDRLADGERPRWLTELKAHRRGDPSPYELAFANEAAKFQAETLTTSFLATRLREGKNNCDRCTVNVGSVVVVGHENEREWVCSSCIGSTSGNAPSPLLPNEGE
jgi:hypothetical protein